MFKCHLFRNEMRGFTFSPRSHQKREDIGMSSSISSETNDTEFVGKVWNVSDFARRYRLDESEETRLTRLLGPFASEQELLVNASRTPLYR